MFRGMDNLVDAVGALEAVAAQKGGIALLAREAGVPESTARSLQQKKWQSKPVDTFEKLASAARRLIERGEAAA